MTIFLKKKSCFDCSQVTLQESCGIWDWNTVVFTWIYMKCLRCQTRGGGTFHRYVVYIAIVIVIGTGDGLVLVLTPFTHALFRDILRATSWRLWVKLCKTRLISPRVYSWPVISRLHGQTAWASFCFILPGINEHFIFDELHAAIL